MPSIIFDNCNLAFTYLQLHIKHFYFRNGVLFPQLDPALYFGLGPESYCIPLSGHYQGWVSQISFSNLTPIQSYEAKTFGGSAQPLLSIRSVKAGLYMVVTIIEPVCDNAPKGILKLLTNV